MEERVLSIQSHVVHGYVGNKAAVFPLQLLGFDVDIVNSVHFSNHTGYQNGFTGEVMNGNQLNLILVGLEKNGLLDNVGHLLTGYIGNESFLKTVLEFLRKRNSPSDTIRNKLRYVCDPVLGDSGKFYVPTELVAIYRDQVIPLADIVTPNQFEAEQLTGVSISNLNDGKRACQALHDLGPNLVVITSLTFPQNDEKDKKITMLASNRIKQSHAPGDDNYKDELWCVDTPILDGNFTGAGDLCAALFLGWTCKEPNNLPLVLQNVVSTIYSILKSTREHHSKKVKNSNAKIENELRLIQSKKLIEDPPALFEAKRVV